MKVLQQLNVMTADKNSKTNKYSKKKVHTVIYRCFSCLLLLFKLCILENHLKVLSNEFSAQAKK
jgi:hypothetical protein